jgi:CRP-like cAMP-binding protein
MSERRHKPVSRIQAQPEHCSLELRLQILSDLPFFEGISEESMRVINASFKEHGVEAGETIYFSADPADVFYVIAQGKIKLLRHSRLGKDVLLDVLTPGDFFGMLSTLGSEEHTETAVAITSCCLLAVRSEDFQSILERHPSTGPTVIRALAKRLQDAHETIRLLSTHQVDKRLAAVLLKLGDRIGVKHDLGQLIDMPISRQDLAEMTASSSETISRIMSDFQTRDWIASGREWIALKDTEAIRKFLET